MEVDEIRSELLETEEDSGKKEEFYFIYPAGVLPEGDNLSDLVGHHGVSQSVSELLNSEFCSS